MVGDTRDYPMSGGKRDFTASKALHSLYGIDRFLSFCNTRKRVKTNHPGGFLIASEFGS